jgi:hypothetical protein
MFPFFNTKKELMALRIFKFMSESFLARQERQLITKIELTKVKLENNRISPKAKQIYSQHIAEARSRRWKVRGVRVAKSGQKIAYADRLRCRHQERRNDKVFLTPRPRLMGGLAPSGPRLPLRSFSSFWSSLIGEGTRDGLSRRRNVLFCADDTAAFLSIGLHCDRSDGYSLSIHASRETSEQEIRDTTNWLTRRYSPSETGGASF